MPNREVLIPYTRMRRILKENCGGMDVSEDSILYIQEYLNQHLKAICSKCVEEHNSLNDRRLTTGLLGIKRLHASICRRVVDKYFNPNQVRPQGEGANQHTSLSRGNEMTNRKPLPKVAGMEVI